MDLSCHFLPQRQHLARRASMGVASATLTRALRAGQIVRVRPGVYAPAPLPVRGRHLLSGGKVDQGYLAETRAVLLSVSGAVADRRTSALLWRMDMLEEPSRVEIKVPHGKLVSLTGVDVRTSRDGSQVELEVEGSEAVAVGTAAGTVLDCCLDRPLREAVVIADSALRNGAVTVEDLVAAVEARARHPRSARLRRLLALVDPASGSVLESLLRYLLVQAGLEPQSQYTVRIGKERIGRFDFCFERARLIVECDGRRWHDPEDAREKDRVRANGLARANWRLLRFTWAEVMHNGPFVLRCVRECLVAAA